MRIQVDKPFRRRVEKTRLRRLVKETLAAAGVNSAAEVSLVITDDHTVCQLNQKYRGLDHTTDVLSFALLESDKNSHFALPPDGVLHPGEVIISYPQAARQAQEYQRPVGREIELLVVHGILHLLGYDHEEPEAERGMKALEEKVLRAVPPPPHKTSVTG